MENGRQLAPNANKDDREPIDKEAEPDRADFDGRSSTSQLRYLLQQGETPMPELVAGLIRENPGDREAIFALLQKSLGNTYVQHVLAALESRSAAEPTPTPAAAS
jgi:hypothetical protein